MKLKDIILGEAIVPRGSEPLDGKSKTNAKNWVLGKVNSHAKGFFSDVHWTPIHKIWKEFDALRLNWTMTGAKYEEEIISTDAGSRYSVPVRKIWSFEITFVNNRDKNDKMFGTITAAGAGSGGDPLDRYDVTVTLS